MLDQSILNKMADAIVQGDRDEAVRLAQQAVDQNYDLNRVIESGYVQGIQKVGDLWEKGEYFLPELITSADCMKAAISIIEPHIIDTKGKARSKGKVIIGTVEGDIHDIGKNLVASMLSANGFEVFDLGADVKLERFIEKAEDVEADYICLSALLTTTMLGQRRFIELLKSRKLSGKYKILVGGAPVTEKWAKDIGADGYAENAPSAVKLLQGFHQKSGGKT